MAAGDLDDGEGMLLGREFEEPGVFLDEKPREFMMEIPDDLWRVVFAMGEEIIAEIDLLGEFFEILLADPHPRVMEITAQEDAVDLIRVQLVDLLADQLVAEIDDA